MQCDREPIGSKEFLAWLFHTFKYYGEFLIFMEEIVRREFEQLRGNIGKRVRITVVDNEGEHTSIHVLNDVDDYLAIVLDGVECGSEIQSVVSTDYWPFVGAEEGIKQVETMAGEVLYRNGHLRYEKPVYDVFSNPNDREYVDDMRRRKFGPGHDLRRLS